MAKVTVHFESGEPERVIEFDPAKAPFQHDGRPGSILDVLLGTASPLEHACGGNCACTTCHVVVKRGGTRSAARGRRGRGGPARQGAGLTPTSRLGCQAVVSDPDAEIEITVPRYTINMVSGTPWLRSAARGSLDASSTTRADTRSLLLRVPGERLAFRPGQFLSCLLPVGGERAHPSLLHRLRSRGAGALELCSTSCRTDRARTTCSSSARATTIRFTGPWGTFVLDARPTRRSSSSPSDAASRPIRPMVRRALADRVAPGPPPVRHATHPVYRDELAALPRPTASRWSMPARARGRGRAPLDRRRRRPLAPLLRLRRRAIRCARSATAPRGGGYARRAVQYERW